MSTAIAATYYRTGLLLGLVPGAEVLRWAEAVIAREPAPASDLLELALVRPTDLSALRHALWPLAVEPEPEVVLEAVLARIHADLESGARSLTDTVTVLRQMRSMLRLPAGLYATLNLVLVDHASIGTPGSPVPEWLRRFAPAGLDPLAA